MTLRKEITNMGIGKVIEYWTLITHPKKYAPRNAPTVATKPIINMV